MCQLIISRLHFCAQSGWYATAAECKTDQSGYQRIKKHAAHKISDTVCGRENRVRLSRLYYSQQGAPATQQADCVEQHEAALTGFSTEPANAGMLTNNVATTNKRAVRIIKSS
jgi:hypothetical protein